MTEPLISVIIPVYNCEQYLAAAVESVLGQTYQTIEVIVID
ncbi:MAG: glycosyltransferase, partial [Cyanobacteria bacterium J06588_4]